MSYVRGSNPVWSFVDLTGKQFDDTFYMYVLQNTLPYLPSTVWHDFNGNSPWSQPIQFYANGTLPIDIYWDPSVVYRLEFRQNNGLQQPSQQDPLIYLVENYQPGSTGTTPVGQSITTDNQITNPQFALVDFVSPFAQINITTQTIRVAPGWFLDLTGTGNVTLNRIALNSSVTDPSNAPYALHIQLSGTWTGAVLRQRFNENGVLWSNTFVSSSITALSATPPNPISAAIYDSLNNLLTTVLPSTPLTETFVEYPGVGEILASANTNTPPAAWIEYRLTLPTTCDITLTSLQLVSGDLELEYPYEQTTVERQIDQTFHHYKNSILLQPKDDILVAWNFPLNPWQQRTTANTTIGSNIYITDQTILSAQNPGSLAVSRASDGRLAITTVAATTQQNFAIIQYIDPTSILPYWGSILSSLATLGLTTTHGTLLTIKMKLIYSSTLPSTVDPIASWSAGEPVFTGQWTAVEPINSPVNTVSSATPASFPYNGFQMPAFASSTQCLGVVFYTTSALGQSDVVSFNRISLVPNMFAIDTNPKTSDQVLRDAFFYYESSYAPGVLFGTPNAGGSLFAEMLGIKAGTDSVRSRSFGFPFKEVARTTAPLVTLFSPITGATGQVSANLLQNGTGPVGGTADAAVSSFWATFLVSAPGITYKCANGSSLLSGITTSGDANPEGFITYHYTKDARLGLHN
jgi:hypothetical protein